MFGKGEDGILPCIYWVGPPLGNMDSIGQGGSKLEEKVPWMTGEAGRGTGASPWRCTCSCTFERSFWSWGGPRSRQSAAGTGLAARTPLQSQYISFALDESDTGEVRFEEQRLNPWRQARHFQLIAKKKPPPPADSAGPVTATLRDAWDLAPATEFNPDTTDPSATSHESGGQEPGDSARGVTTSFFQVAAHGLRIVYLLDGSASMGANGALAAACRELRASVQKLPGLARFQIIIYNDQAHVLLPRYQDWLEPTPSVLRAVDDALESLARQVPEGGTDHEPALKMAFLLRPDVVYFLTDADDLKPQHLRLVRSLNQSRAIVHTIPTTIATIATARKCRCKSWPGKTAGFTRPWTWDVKECA